MIAALWNRLWDMHYDTKALITINIKVLSNKFKNHFFSSSESKHEHDVDIADEMQDAPAESAKRVHPSPEGMEEGESREYSNRQKLGLILGIVVFAVMLLIPTPSGMEVTAQKMTAVTLLMAIWWICESIPIPATSLLPIFLFPILGIMDTKKACAPYASDLIYLFMGGFIIALAMQRWNLHRRIAMNIVKMVGFSPSRIILGFMVATAFLSAFVSNTATTVMMMPIGMAIINHVITEGKKEGLHEQIDFSSPTSFSFGLNLMLGIAYAASIGGIATLIGTPPNTVLSGYLANTYGYQLTFSKWMVVGVPLVLIFLPLSWFYLIKIANPMTIKKIPGGKDLIKEELRKMGPLSTGEKWTSIIFALTALFWILRPVIGSYVFPFPKMVTDAAIAMTSAAILFVIPIDLKNNVFVMNWHWAKKIPWGVLILFGGGLALASGFQTSKLAGWIAVQVKLLSGSPTLLIIIVVSTLIIFLTELTSNTATAAMFMPILAAVAIGLGENPLLLLVPAAIAASCAFMLPVATPPNAIVFASGYVSIPKMARTGLGLNIMGIIIVTILVYLILIPLFDISMGKIPEWALKAVK